MDKKTQDLAWACLPKEAREEIRKQYRIVSKNPQLDRCDSVYLTALENIFGQNNLTSDTEPEEMLMVSRKDVQEQYETYKEIERWSNDGPKGYKDRIRGKEVMFVLDELFGDKCLPDTPNTPNSGVLKPQSVEGQPKFHEGEIVVCLEDGRVGCVAVVQISDNGYVYELVDDKARLIGVFNATELEYYTEPETKDMEEKELGKEDNFPTKELNLCELLKDCIGEEFYSLIDGEVKLKQLTDDVICQYHKYHRCGYLSGCSLDGACLLYPSRSLYEKYPLDAFSAWMEWKEARKPKKWVPQIGERIFWVNSHGTVSQDVCRSDIEGNGHQLKRRAIGNEFKTGKEAEQAAEVVKEALRKFYEQSQK